MALIGIQPAQVGGEYDLAIGFDPGTGDTTMLGYVIETGTEWAEAPNIQDEQRIVQIASPNNSDRLTYYPKVTQDDWSGGEGQEYFTDPTKYYQSYKVDPTKPGHLVLTPGTTSPPAVSLSTRGPAASDGFTVLIGALLSSPNSLQDMLGNPFQLDPAGTPEPLFMVLGPSGVWIATATGTRGGIYRITSNLPYGPAPPASQPTPVLTGSTREQDIKFLCNTATGLLYATQEDNAGSFAVNAYIYTFDGTTSVRVFDFRGWVRAGYEMGGVTYLLLEYQQFPGGGALFNTYPQFTLMSYVNGQFTTLFDQRYASADFHAAGFYFSSSLACSLTGDGRFLYIAWPGFYPIVFDTVRSAFIRWGGAPAVQPSIGGTSGEVYAHRLFPTTQGLVDVVLWGTTAPYTLAITVDNALPDTGYVVSSWIDFGAPGIVKAFRCVEVEMQQPIPASGSVQVSYRTDQSQPFTLLTNQLVLPNGNLMIFLPLVTKAYRIQLRLTLNAAAGVSPVVRSISLTGNAARVWQIKLSCRRGQQKRNNNDDDHGTSTDLLANILGAYQQGGYVTMFIPDPTNPLGTGTGTPYVSQTTAKIEDYNWHTAVSPGNRQDVDGNGYASEGVVDVVLAEQL